MNNFDMSSTGTNIEFSIFLDTDDASRLFDEAFERVKNINLPKGYYGDALFYKDFGENEYDDSEQDRNYAIDCDSKDLLRKFCTYSGETYRDALRTLEVSSKDDTDEILQSIETYYQWEESYLNFLSEHFTLRWTLYMSRGYSQGDCVTVVLPSHYQLLDHWQQVQEGIDHFLWDAPIYVGLTVDGEAYYVELEDRYDYDQDKVLTAVDKAIEKLSEDKREVVREFLITSLPKDLEYI